ncbi:MAG: leucine-rich repeat domain-containing protein [Treponema sp.]|jgi:hypothetical protein|nr:leucine-rich repeat domain-containing protein [Treponema sp.]
MMKKMLYLLPAAVPREAPGGTPGNPAPMALDSGFDFSTGWDNLLSGIAAAEQYVALDLSACTISGSFNPGTAGGKKYIVSLALPAGVTAIGGSAFRGCTALQTADFPAVKSIGIHAFNGCTALQTVSLPKAETIGYLAFYGCTALQTVSLPRAETIGIHAFNGCTALQTVSLPRAKTIGYHAFNGCTALQTVSFPKAKNIRGSAFSGCTALQTVSLLTAKTIGYLAFYGCTALQTVSLPKAKTIGGSAFSGCTALQTVSLPAAKSIGKWVFHGSGAQALTVTLGAARPSVRRDIFSSVDAAKDVTVRVPSGALSAYDSPFDNSGASDNWGNAFRGRGWNGRRYEIDLANTNINLTIEAVP